VTSLSGHGWEEYALSDGKGTRKIDPSAGPLSHSLAVLGMPGLTAFKYKEDITDGWKMRRAS
jgi:NADPH-dependent curcumin reductase CurA